MRKRRVLRKRVNGKKINLRKRKTERVETVKAEEFYNFFFKQQNQELQNNCSEKETFRNYE